MVLHTLILDNIATLRHGRGTAPEYRGALPYKEKAVDFALTGRHLLSASDTSDRYMRDRATEGAELARSRMHYKWYHLAAEMQYAMSSGSDCKKEDSKGA
jgi:hypothetical protein